MYKCNSREIHYASLQKLSGMPETAWEWGVRVLCWGLVGGIRVGPARATCHSGQASGRSSPARGRSVRSQSHPGCATWTFCAVTWKAVKRQHHTAWGGDSEGISILILPRHLGQASDPSTPTDLRNVPGHFLG